MSDEKKWYVMYVQDPRKIQHIMTTFQASPSKDFTIWVPVQQIMQVERGSRVLKDKPLFPGYVFVHFAYTDATLEDKLLSGGSFLKKAGCKHPTPMTEEEVSRIKQLETTRAEETPLTRTFNIRLNDKVEIVSGSFLGQRGRVIALKGDKVVVEVDIFGRSVPAEVDPSFCVSPNERNN